MVCIKSGWHWPLRLSQWACCRGIVDMALKPSPVQNTINLHFHINHHKAGNILKLKHNSTAVKGHETGANSICHCHLFFINSCFVSKLASSLASGDDLMNHCTPPERGNRGKWFMLLHRETLVSVAMINVRYARSTDLLDAAIPNYGWSLHFG